MQGKLISIGHDGDGLKSLTLKAWDLSSPSTTTAPTTITTSKLFPSGKPPEGDLTAIALSAHQWPAVVIAVGLSTGSVQLLKGDALKGKLARAFPPQTLPGGGGSITSLHFSGPQHIFATSSTHVAAISAQTGQQVMTDDCGAQPGCTAVVEDSKELLLAGPEAVCFYSVEEGRKAAFAIKGEKHAVACFGRFLIATTPTTTSTAIASLQVFDLHNKILGAAVEMIPPVQWVVSCPGLGVVAADAAGAGVKLMERTLSEKLEALYRSGSYHLALSVAIAEKVRISLLVQAVYIKALLSILSVLYTMYLLL